MTEKRYKISDEAHYVYSDIYDSNEILRNDEVVDLLNEQSDKITEQAIQIDFLKDENKHMRQVLEENEQLKREKEKIKSKAEKFVELYEIDFGKTYFTPPRVGKTIRPQLWIVRKILDEIGVLEW